MMVVQYGRAKFPPREPAVDSLMTVSAMQSPEQSDQELQHSSKAAAAQNARQRFHTLQGLAHQRIHGSAIAHVLLV